eukprot:3642604-Rhodomonas_salina.1
MYIDDLERGPLFAILIWPCYFTATSDLIKNKKNKKNRRRHTCSEKDTVPFACAHANDSMTSEPPSAPLNAGPRIWEHCDVRFEEDGKPRARLKERTCPVLH